MNENRPKLSKDDIKKAFSFGGFSLEDWFTEEDDNTHYSEKPHHAERSIYHQPNHLKFWNKKQKDQ